MSFLDRLRGGNQHDAIDRLYTQGAVGDSRTEAWNMNPEQKTREQFDKERNTRKLVRSLAYGLVDSRGYVGRGAVRPDVSVLRNYDVAMSDNEYDAVLQGVSEGIISDRTIEELMKVMDFPGGTREGCANILNEMNRQNGVIADRFKSIVGYEIGVGSDRPNDIFAAELALFTGASGNNGRYEPCATPKEYDKLMGEFATRLEDGSDEQREYERLRDYFGKVIYGERYDYWQVYKGLKAEAEAEKAKESRVRKMGRVVLSHAKRLSGLEQSFEDERSGEWKMGEAMGWRVSKEQVVGGLPDIENLEWPDDERCQDRTFLDPSIQMFGVFDGVGDSGVGMNGGKAAQAACGRVMIESRRRRVKNVNDLVDILGAADRAVRAEQGAGYTTAVLAKVVEEDDRSYLTYASIGDSRIYIVHADDSVEQVTKDDGFGKVIDNALGYGSGGVRVNYPNYGKRELLKGDRVMLCSDGITGDYGQERMSNEQIGEIMRKARSAEEAVKMFVTEAKKIDDRSEIIIGEFPRR